MLGLLLGLLGYGKAPKTALGLPGLIRKKPLLLRVLAGNGGISGSLAKHMASGPISAAYAYFCGEVRMRYGPEPGEETWRGHAGGPPLPASGPSTLLISFSKISEPAVRGFPTKSVAPFPTSPWRVLGPRMQS